jgi:predicted tellurium resistance membrane protein TerC
MMHLDIHDTEEKKPKSVNMIIAAIVIMNLVFSFDSILGAIALTDVFWVMAVAIVIGGLLMIWLSGKVTEFLKKNRMYEVLGLFILLVVGIMLLSEGGHLAKLELFGNHITPMSKTTFYFVITILVIVDLVQSKYQKNLTKKR